MIIHERVSKFFSNDVYFKNIPELNSVDFRVQDGQLIVSNFLKAGADMNGASASCKRAEILQRNPKPFKTVGNVFMYVSTPDPIFRYLMFPGFADAIVRQSYGFKYDIVETWSDYDDGVRGSFRSIMRLN